MKKELAMKYNRRIFPIYKGFSWQPLFYYAIIYLFLTDVKGISPSKVMYAESFYALFLILLQTPSTIIIEKIGSKRSVVIGTIFATIQITMMIFINSYVLLITAYFMSAFGNALKYTARNTLLYDSTIICKGKNSFANINAKGSSLFYILNAISGITTGYLYVINPYLPLVFSSIVSCLATIIACRFEEVKINAKQKITMEESIRDLKQGFLFIIKSKRLRALFLFILIFPGFIILSFTYEEYLLMELNVSPQYFGIFFGLLGLVQGFSVLFQDKIHKKFKNKSLAFISILFFVFFIMIGTVVRLKMDFIITIIIIICILILLYSIKGPYWILEDRYITNFTNSKNRAKILSANNIIEYMGQMLVGFVVGLLLEFYEMSKVYIIIGIGGLVVAFIVLAYMKNRVGLKAEEYDKSDLQYEE